MKQIMTEGHERGVREEKEGSRKERKLEGTKKLDNFCQLMRLKSTSNQKKERKKI